MLWMNIKEKYQAIEYRLMGCYMVIYMLLYQGFFAEGIADATYVDEQNNIL